MKSILSIVAVCALFSLAGCNSTKSNSVSPGAVGEKGACCSDKSAACCSEAKTSMGAVGEKAECSKTCPVTGKTETVSPGAVSDAPAKSGCCSGKSSCQK